MSCCLCKKDADDLIDFGQIMTKSGITVHYYCVLLSTNLLQLGSTDSAGFLGFQIKEVSQEIKLAAKRKCVYCNDFHASISCRKCADYFHLKCGLENGCNFQFIDEFKSYCHKHNDYKTKTLYTKNSICCICYSRMGKFDPINSIISDCCSTVMHKRCLKKYALSAGYYLKCIGCNCLEFRDKIKYYGIFVPDCDASWELDPDFFKALYEKYSRCDAKICHCSLGREFNDKNKKKWKINTCNVCAKSGIHGECLKTIRQNNNEVYTCEDCITIFNKTICARNIETFRTLINGTLLFQIGEESQLNTDQNSINNNFYTKKQTKEELVASQSLFDQPRDVNENNSTTYPQSQNFLDSNILEFYERDFETNKIVKIIRAKLKNGIELKDNISHEDLEIVEEISPEPDGSFEVGEYEDPMQCLMERLEEIEKKALQQSSSLLSVENIDLCESSDEEDVEELFEKITKKKYLNVPKPLRK